MPLFGLGPLIGSLLGSISTFFLNAQLPKLVFKIAFYATIVALYAAFVIACLALANGFRVAMPDQFAFAFGFIPQSVPAMFGAYMASIVAKRLLDMKVLFILHGTK